MVLTGWLLVAMMASPIPPVAAPPAWVESVELPGDAGVDEGESHLLLRDVQVRAAKTVEVYRHEAWKVLTVGGVQSLAQRQLEWDPTWSKLTLHGFWVWRDGQRRDAWNPEDARVVQRESGRTESLYDGRLTVLVELRDVRPGDIIEFASTVTGENPVFNGHFDWSSAPVWSDAVARSRLRLVWERPRELHLKSFGGLALPQRTTEAGATVYRWDLHDLKPFEFERGVPADVTQGAWVAFSDWADWHEVATWAAKLFAVPTKGARFDAAVRRFEAMPEEGRAEAIVRFVQDDIRYVGVELGAHSHQPHAPEWVLERGFGDCKDKALLLVSLLRAVGVQAAPALVDSDDGLFLPQASPGTGGFNHAIAKVELPGGVTRFIDGTRTRQRGALEHFANPSFHWALVVSHNTTALEAMPVELPQTPTWEVEQVWTTLPGGRVSLRFTTIARGESAPWLRRYLADQSREELVKHKREDHEKDLHETVTAKSLSWEDDEAANVVTLHELYELDQFWKEGRRSLEVFDLSGDLTKLNDQHRRLPFALPYPVFTKETLRWEDDEPFGARFVSGDHSVRHEAFELGFVSAVSGSTLMLSWHYKTLKDRVEPAQVESYRAAYTRAWDSLSYNVKWGSAEPKRAPDPKFDVWFFTILCAVAMGILALVAFLQRTREYADNAKTRLRMWRFKQRGVGARGELASAPASAATLEETFKLFSGAKCPRGHLWPTPQRVDTVRLGEERVTVVSRRCSSCDAREDRYVKLGA